ncbi:MAG: flagellar hook-associated protein FlgK [Lachnospiraceae bacterium]
MANGMGSLYIGASGLQSSQNALNTTANNLANVDTKGYVRQQVLFGDRDYTTFGNSMAGISKQQAGLGVSIADVAHTRDYFLDKYYRSESGRQAFYEANNHAIDEIQTAFQELSGQTFQDSMNDFWVSFQELVKDPSAEVNQNLVIQKAVLFLEGAQGIRGNIKDYQDKINIKVTESIDKINELGTKIRDLNLEIQKIESGGVETAMTLRDERDNALDELSQLAKIEFKEDSDGTVKVKLEGVSFVDEVNVYKMEGLRDPITEFVNPIWPHLSDMDREQYTNVFDFGVKISSELNTDIGKLKGLILSRGDHVADYRDIEGLTAEQYNAQAGMSVMLSSGAEFDQLVHKLVTSLNDILSPTVTTTFTGTDGTVYSNVKVWDEVNGPIGADGQKPGRELFVRRGCERYTQVSGLDAQGNPKTYYVYNEEDTTDTSKMYTTSSIVINQDLLEQEANLPHLKENMEIDQDMAKALVKVWSDKDLYLNPNDNNPCNFEGYYEKLIDELATKGSVYNSVSTSLSGTVSTIENQRQQVFGVSSDEELTNMIKYQNAYNAASRYINVISEMLEHVITQLG